MAGPKAHIFVQETADAVSASVSENEQKLTDWAEVSHSTTEPASVLIHGIQHKKSSNVAEGMFVIPSTKIETYRLFYSTRSRCNTQENSPTGYEPALLGDI